MSDRKLKGCRTEGLLNEVFFLILRGWFGYLPANADSSDWLDRGFIGLKDMHL
jgi:hypothetical protein